MHFKLKLGNISVDGVEMKDIHVETEFSLEEAQGSLAITKQIVDSIPELLAGVKKGFEAFEALENEMSSPSFKPANITLEEVPANE